jgi:hypothetical protein
MKFRQDIAQQRKPHNDNAYLRWMIGWATIAGTKKMASSYEEQPQDRVSPLAHHIHIQSIVNLSTMSDTTNKFKYACLLV